MLAALVGTAVDVKASARPTMAELLDGVWLLVSVRPRLAVRPFDKLKILYS